VVRIRVRTPARLHMGLLDLHGGLGRIYGGIGVAVENPSVELEAESWDSLVIEGCGREYVAETVERLAKRYGLNCRERISVKKCIPSHVGLGSRTQLALAVAAALARIHGLESSVDELAVALGRGKISGVGVAVFKSGGFVVDGGRRIGSTNTTPPQVLQVSFPSRWSFVLAIPRSLRGPTDTEEEQIFRSLPKMDELVSARLCRLLMMKMLPALYEEDIQAFGEALTEVQRIVGGYFSQVQGGVFSNPLAEKLVEKLLSTGAAGVGQSSWGPTLYGLYEGMGEAGRAAAELGNMLGEEWYVMVSQPSNHGAEISVSSQIL
jgi:beta-RFAP synthase